MNVPVHEHQAPSSRKRVRLDDGSADPTEEQDPTPIKKKLICIIRTSVPINPTSPAPNITTGASSGPGTETTSAKTRGLAIIVPPGNPDTMSAIKQEVDLIDTGVNGAAKAVDAATKLAFRSFPIQATPQNKPAPRFKVNEYVCHRDLSRGGMVKAVARPGPREGDSYVYKLAGKDTQKCTKWVYDEPELQTSEYAVGDIVEVDAFGETVERTIMNIHFIRQKGFLYDIGGGFKARREDIAMLVARGA